jgi:peptide/nickel transport system substrate-binding protein
VKRAIHASAVALVLATCVPAAWANKANDTLVYASDQEVENIGPYHNNLREGIILARLAWDTLIYADPKTGAYKPELATAWSWESPTSLLLDLRSDVKFHNGDRFTAADVAFTFNYALSPASKIVTRQNVEWIESVEKVSEFRVRIKLKEPFPSALAYLAGPLPIYPENYFKAVGVEGYSKAPIGTGPYRIERVVPGQGVTLVRNAAYFAGSPLGQPKIRTIRFVVVPDAEARVAQLLTGDVDWIWRVPADQLDPLRAMPALAVQSGETMRVGYIAMDAVGSSAPNSPFKDVRVRKAVNLAINRAGIADSLIRGGSQPVFTPCFRTQFGCDGAAAVKYAYDPAKAKALLAEAGYSKGFDTDIYAYRERDYVEALIGDLRKVGINARLHFMKYPAMQTEMRAGHTPMIYQAWASYSLNDASAFAGVYFKGTSDDMAKDAQVKEWLYAADRSLDPVVRKANYSKAIERITQQAYWAPVASYSINYAYTKDLNFQAYPDELPRFYEASWK